ncbi:MAG: valine--tRNA ligase [Prolixibacteraceae bacterium]|nr:valine--tRNA ligase [Prolixibacteraceae bacterium]
MTMEIPGKYNPANVEEKWYKYWMDNKFFHSEPDEREPYTIVIPPPNVTGVLHMGHMLNNTIQDILVRRARMMGKNACWVPGTDHASIATEAKVVGKLKSEGIDKHDIGREAFLEHAWEWTHKHGGIILEQLKKLGASCDWDRTCFTMDEERSKSVIKVFIDLYNKGLVYRGVRMVNWDPQAKTAVSDEEVIYKEEQSKLYYVRYKIEAPLNPPGGGKEAPLYKTARKSDYELLKKNAKRLRRFSTEAESALWEMLRAKKLGEKFRRQHIINDIIVDFVCLPKKLVIEVDGGYHNNPEIQDLDTLKTEILNQLGYNVIRFTNDEVLANTDSVLETIRKALFSPPPGESEGASYVTIATTRPETILGDTAVCVNPNDERFTHLKGKKVLVPLVNRSIPIIEDEYVDMEFGTGCLKITPAHDVNDYEIGMRHNLETIDTFNDDGTMSENAGLLVGVDRFDARKQIVPLLEEAGNMVKIEDYNNKVGYSERTNVPIEPKLSAQWFIAMEEIAKPALEAVESDEVAFHPSKFKNVYRHWMSNIKDWCISRQLWWGHQIPVYYLNDGSYVVAETADEALNMAKEKTGNENLTMEDLRQDEDVLDTWASSWLWPIAVFGGVTDPDNKEINYYHPTSDLVTGHDIIFFWVARMIMASYGVRNEKPFDNVYFTGMVRDSQRRKMSKSLGNSPDPLELIEKYGADGVRVGMLFCSPAGGDLLFEESLPEQGRNFSAKIWNAFRLVKNWEVSSDIEQPEHSKLALEWFESKLSEVFAEMNDHFDKFRISDALMLIYTTVRDEFSSWLLEIVKPGYQQPIDRTTYKKVIELFDYLMRLLHPFMPFITEEIWQMLEERKDGESIMVSQMQELPKSNQNLNNDFEDVKEAITGVRNIRKSNNISFKDEIELFVNEGSKGYHEKYNAVLTKMGSLSKIEPIKEDIKGAVSFSVKTSGFFIDLGDQVDVEAEIKKLEEELKYTKGFLNGVTKKLSNERFINNAPENVVELERKKQTDAEDKIKALEERIAALK